MTDADTARLRRLRRWVANQHRQCECSLCDDIRFLLGLIPEDAGRDEAGAEEAE